MVKNVTMPPRTSRVSVEPRSVMRNSRSSGSGAREPVGVWWGWVMSATAGPCRVEAGILAPVCVGGQHLR